MKRPFKLLIFDWDGTLMDSEARIVACIRAAIEELDLPERGTDEIRNIIGLGLKEAVDRLYPNCDERLHEDVTACYRHHFLHVNTTPSVLFEGAAEVIRRLRAEGYLLAVATGKGRSGLDKVLAETALEPLFHATRCSDETRSKPDPLMVHEILDDLEVRPEESIVIGDTEYDMEMARCAGTGALAVSYGVHGLERLLRHEPLGHIDRIGELEDWLAGRTGMRPRATA